MNLNSVDSFTTDESVISNPKRSNFDGKGDFLICWWRSPCSISVATCPIWMCSGIFDTYSFQFVQKSSLCIHQNSAKYIKCHGAPAGFSDFPLYRCVTLCTLAKLEIAKSCRGLPRPASSPASVGVCELLSAMHQGSQRSHTLDGGTICMATN